MKYSKKKTYRKKNKSLIGGRLKTREYALRKLANSGINCFAGNTHNSQLMRKCTKNGKQGLTILKKLYKLQNPLPEQIVSIEDLVDNGISNHWLMKHAWPSDKIRLGYRKGFSGTTSLLSHIVPMTYGSASYSFGKTKKLASTWWKTGSLYNSVKSTKNNIINNLVKKGEEISDDFKKIAGNMTLEEQTKFYGSQKSLRQLIDPNLEDEVKVYFIKMTLMPFARLEKIPGFLPFSEKLSSITKSFSGTTDIEKIAAKTGEKFLKEIVKLPKETKLLLDALQPVANVTGVSVFNLVKEVIHNTTNIEKIPNPGAITLAKIMEISQAHNWVEHDN